MKKAVMAAGGCAGTLFAAVPLYVRLGNHDLPLGAATALQYVVAALGLTVALWMSLAIVERRRLPLAEGVVALITAAVLNHVLLFDLVFKGVLDGGPASLATRSAASYLATLLYAAARAGAYILLRRGTMGIGAMSVLVVAVALSTVVAQAISRPRVTLLAERRPPSPDVFRLSGKLNIVHLMPDSLQTDLVQEALEGNPLLRDRLAGFRLYAGHVGAYPTTAPTLPTIFTGEYFDLSRGYQIDEVGTLFRERSFTNVLADAGFAVNVIGLGSAYCGARYANCVTATFGDLTPRGVLDGEREEHINLARLLDLAAVRVVPTLLVPTIYARGNWSLSRALRRLNGFGTVLDPFFHEWAGRMRVDAEAPPTYLFYHYIGSHPPAQWDARCTFTGAMPLARAPLLAQTECVLQGIAELAAALKRANVLDRTVIVVNGDHGTGLAPLSVSVPLANPQVRVTDLGQARAALLIKALGDTGPFRVTAEPTAHLDIRPTLLGIAGLKEDGPGFDLMTEAVPDDRVRLYHVLYDFRWGRTDPVSHVRFAVGRDVLNTEDWSVDAFVAARALPRTFGVFGTRDLTLLQAGAIALGAMDERGLWVAGRRLSVLLAPRDERDNALTVTLRLPEAHAGAGVTIRVNGVIVDRHAVVASADARGWARAQTCVPKSTSRGAHELVELHFSKTSIVAGVAVPVSALVRDIAFDRAPPCGGRHRM
jgi:hypothetical protein